MAQNSSAPFGLTVVEVEGDDDDDDDTFNGGLFNQQLSQSVV